MVCKAPGSPKELGRRPTAMTKTLSSDFTDVSGASDYVAGSRHESAVLYWPGHIIRKAEVI